MKLTSVFLAAFVCLPAVAAAQTEGRISVGATISRVFPTESDVRDTWTYGPLVRLNPKRGWGPAGGFGWFVEFRNRWKADAAVLSAAAVYSLF